MLNGVGMVDYKSEPCVNFFFFGTKLFRGRKGKNHLAPVVPKVENAIHWINPYSVDNAIAFTNTYPLDSD